MSRPTQNRITLQQAITWAARQKSAAGTDTPDGGVGGATSLSGAGALAGLIGGGLWGAYDPGARPALNDNGKPILIRRNRALSALQTALRGSALGGIAGAAIGGLTDDAARRLHAQSLEIPTQPPVRLRSPTQTT